MVQRENMLKGFSCVIGGFLIHFSLGTFYTFGNMSPYMASYLKYRTNNTWVTNGHVVWVFAFAALFLGLIMSLGGMLEKKIGPRITCLLGGWSMSLGTILTYYAIKTNLWSTIVTYGVIFGGGSGLTYSVAISSAMKWFPSRKGMVAGAVAAGYGLGSLIFNIVQTKYINPNNISPNSTTTIEKYFTDDSVLDNVPFCFVIIGTAYAIIQLIGVIMLTNSAYKKPNREVRLSGFSTAKETELENSRMTGLPKESESKTKLLNAQQSISVDSTVTQAIKDKRLWILCTTFFLNGIVIIIISSLYKSFGQTFINNDRYFSIVGAVAAIFNSGGRLIWGRLLDKFPYKSMMTVLTVSMAIIMGSFYFCGSVKNETGTLVMYFIWVCSLFFCLAGSFAMFPAITSQCFGSTNMAIIYGIVFLGFAMSGVIGALICSSLLGLIRYGGLFIVATVTSIISLILTQFFQQNIGGNLPQKFV